MKRMLNTVLLTCSALFILAGCGATTAATAKPTEAAMAKPTEAAMTEKPTGEAMAKPTEAAMTEKPTGEAMAKPTEAAMTEKPTGEAMAQLAAWQTVKLSDARTGEAFTLADFAGKTVYIEPMATWCSNCKQQLGNVKQAKAKLGDKVVFIGLSVETDLAASDLAKYADTNGFDWKFAVLTPDALQQLVTVFGRTAANPPSTPHIIVAPNGTVSALATGIEPADTLITKLQATQS